MADCAIGKYIGLSATGPLPHYLVYPLVHQVFRLVTSSWVSPMCPGRVPMLSSPHESDPSLIGHWQTSQRSQSEQRGSECAHEGSPFLPFCTERRWFSSDMVTASHRLLSVCTVNALACPLQWFIDPPRSMSFTPPPSPRRPDVAGRPSISASLASRLPRLLSSSSLGHPIVYFPITDASSFSYLVTWMYSGDTSVLEDALQRHVIRWTEHETLSTSGCRRK